jgi:hypothetical protein
MKLLQTSDPSTSKSPLNNYTSRLIIGKEQPVVSTDGTTSLPSGEKATERTVRDCGRKPFCQSQIHRITNGDTMKLTYKIDCAKSGELANEVPIPSLTSRRHRYKAVVQSMLYTSSCNVSPKCAFTWRIVIPSCRVFHAAIFVGFFLSR